MTERIESADDRASSDRGQPDRLDPLPGEAGIPNVASRRRIAVSKKGLFAVALLIVSMIVVAGVSMQRLIANGSKADDDATKLAGDRPAASTTEPRRLEMPLPLPVAAPPSRPEPQIPAIVSDAVDPVEPIGVRSTGSPAPKQIPPEDAPIMLVSTRPGSATAAARNSPPARDPAAEPGAANDAVANAAQNLEAYQRQLQGLLDNLTRGAAMAVGEAGAQMPPTGSLLGGMPAGIPATEGALARALGSPGGSLFGGQLQGSATPRVSASSIGDRSLILPKGSSFTCALKTKVISASSGLVGCQIQRNVYSDNGRVLLIERGSHLDGEYRIAAVRPGTVRIPVLWTRIRTPNGVTVDIDSPGTGRLGEAGIDGHVDNRWGERLGAAMLLSLIDDSVKLVVQDQASDRQGDTIVLPSTTSGSSKLAEKVLDSTINIPPLIQHNQGGIVGIYVARDVDFSAVYELRPSHRQTARESRSEQTR